MATTAYVYLAARSAAGDAVNQELSRRNGTRQNNFQDSTQFSMSFCSPVFHLGLTLLLAAHVLGTFAVLALGVFSVVH